MGKSQASGNKQEHEKKKLQKRKEKEQRREERRAHAKDGKSLEDMLAYVDEDGNITTTPPDPGKKKTVNTEDIIIGARAREEENETPHRTGTVTFFNTAKGYGFIRDDVSKDSVFVHINAMLSPVKENDRVSFETQRGPKGLAAVNVKKI